MTALRIKGELPIAVDAHELSKAKYKTKKAAKRRRATLRRRKVAVMSGGLPSLGKR